MHRAISVKQKAGHCLLVIARFIDKNAYVGILHLKRDVGKQTISAC
jgi:hypothetical protein